MRIRQFRMVEGNASYLSRQISPPVLTIIAATAIPAADYRREEPHRVNLHTYIVQMDSAWEMPNVPGSKSGMPAIVPTIPPV